MKQWPTIETNGAIFVWYHADGEKPTWEPEIIKEITANQWVYQVRTEHHVNCHMQEIPENGADVSENYSQNILAFALKLTTSPTLGCSP